MVDLYRSKSPVFLSLVLLALAPGCSSSESAPGPAGASGGNGPPELSVVPGAPTSAGEEPAAESHTLEGYAAAMASNGDMVAVGTTTAVYEAAASGPALLSIVGDEPNLPLATGEVRAMGAYNDGLLIAAEHGLFFTKGGVLQLSAGNDALHALGITAMTSRVADDDGDGNDETLLALLAGGKAYELEGAELRAWTVDGEAGAPTAVLGQKERVFLAYGRRVYEIDKAKETAYPLAFDIGHVREIACNSRSCDEGSLIYFASDAGLVERSPDGAYTLYTLAAEGEPATAVETFALDLRKQRLYALAGSSVLRIREGELPDAVAKAPAPPPGIPRRMAVDKLGDVWAGEGLEVRKLALGTPLSFSTDVRPIMHEYCADCHGAGVYGAPKIDFEAHATLESAIETVLGRVTSGSMPPPNYGKKLPKEKLQILQDWSVTKAP